MEQSKALRHVSSSYTILSRARQIISAAVSTQDRSRATTEQAMTNLLRTNRWVPPSVTTRGGDRANGFGDVDVVPGRHPGQHRFHHHLARQVLGRERRPRGESTSPPSR